MYKTIFGGLFDHASHPPQSILVLSCPADCVGRVTVAIMISCDYNAPLYKHTQ